MEDTLLKDTVEAHKREMKEMEEQTKVRFLDLDLAQEILSSLLLYHSLLSCPSFHFSFTLLLQLSPFLSRSYFKDDSILSSLTLLRSYDYYFTRILGGRIKYSLHIVEL